MFIMVFHIFYSGCNRPEEGCSAALNWAVNEMEERYKKFAEHKARNIIGYNAQIDQIEDVPGKDRPKKSHRSL